VTVAPQSPNRLGRPARLVLRTTAPRWRNYIPIAVGPKASGDTATGRWPVCASHLDVPGYTGRPPGSVLRYIDCCRCDHDNLRSSESPRTSSLAKGAPGFSVGKTTPPSGPSTVDSSRRGVRLSFANQLVTEARPRMAGSRGSDDRAERSVVSPHTESTSAVGPLSSPRSTKE
jgi:hypothetical protein